MQRYNGNGGNRRSRPRGPRQAGNWQSSGRNAPPNSGGFPANQNMSAWNTMSHNEMENFTNVDRMPSYVMHKLADSLAAKSEKIFGDQVKQLKDIRKKWIKQKVPKPFLVTPDEVNNYTYKILSVKEGGGHIGTLSVDVNATIELGKYFKPPIPVNRTLTLKKPKYYEGKHEVALEQLDTVRNVPFDFLVSILNGSKIRPSEILKVFSDAMSTTATGLKGSDIQIYLDTNSQFIWDKFNVRHELSFMEVMWLEGKRTEIIKKRASSDTGEVYNDDLASRIAAFKGTNNIEAQVHSDFISDNGSLTDLGAKLGQSNASIPSSLPLDTHSASGEAFNVANILGPSVPNVPKDFVTWNTGWNTELDRFFGAIGSGFDWSKVGLTKDTGGHILLQLFSQLTAKHNIVFTQSQIDAIEKVDAKLPNFRTAVSMAASSVESTWSKILQK